MSLKLIKKINKLKERKLIFVDTFEEGIEILNNIYLDEERDSFLIDHAIENKNHIPRSNIHVFLNMFRNFSCMGYQIKEYLNNAKHFTIICPEGHETQIRKQPLDDNIKNGNTPCTECNKDMRKYRE